MQLELKLGPTKFVDLLGVGGRTSWRGPGALCTSLLATPMIGELIGINTF